MSFTVVNCCHTNICDQHPTSTGLEGIKFGIVDIILNVDSSASIVDSSWTECKNFIKKLINTLPISENEIRIGIIQFATTAAVKSKVIFDRLTLLSVVDNMGRIYGAGSNGHLGLDLALIEFEFVMNVTRNCFFPKIIINISDGGWNGGNLNNVKSINALVNSQVNFTFIVKDDGTTFNEDGSFPEKLLYAYQPYYIVPGSTYETDFNKIVTFISGLTLMPITNLLRYSGIGGFSINFGGNVRNPGDVLQYNLPASLFAATTLTNSTLNILSNGFIIPYSCILVSAAGYSSTSSASAKATIHIDGNQNTSLIINAGNFTNTGKKILPLLYSRTYSNIPAGSLIEIRINDGAIGNCQINLYFA
jgi:hypothetical protein